MRFKGFEGEWEKMRLGDIGSVKMCKRIFNEQTTPEGEIPFYKIGSFGKKADAYISKELYLDYRDRFSFPKKGEILISAAGTIGRTVVYNGEDAYYQDSNIVWIDNDNSTVSNEFLYYVLQIVTYNTEGGTIQRLYNNILKATKFNCPSLVEQQKIASLLTLIDERIVAQSKIIQRLETLIQGLREKLFTQRLRFKDEDGQQFPDWEVKKLGEIVEFYKGSSLSKGDISADGQIKCIHYGELFTIYEEIISVVVSRTNKGGLHSQVGDVLMPSSDVTPLGLATASVILESGVVLGGDINVLRPFTEINPVFLSYLLNYEKKKVIELVSGTTVKHIYSKDLKNIHLLIPISRKEQTYISGFLSAIGKKIETEKKILEQYKNQKKFLLQNLFI